MTKSEMKALKLGDVVWDVYTRQLGKVAKITPIAVHIDTLWGRVVRKFRHHNLVNKREHV